MFNIFSTQHILLLAVIVMLVMGPADLPRMMRMAARVVMKSRSMALSLRRTLEHLADTAELDGLRAEINALKRKHPLSSLEAARYGKRPYHG